jgi:hypothetical protein
VAEVIASIERKQMGAFEKCNATLGSNNLISKCNFGEAAASQTESVTGGKKTLMVLHNLLCNPAPSCSMILGELT